MLNMQKLSGLFTPQFYPAQTTLKVNHARIQRVGPGLDPAPPPVENCKHIGYLNKTDPDPLENH